MDSLIVSCGITVASVIVLIFSHKVRNQETRHDIRIFGSVFLAVGISGLIRSFTGHQLGS